MFILAITTAVWPPLSCVAWPLMELQEFIPIMIIALWTQNNTRMPVATPRMWCDSNVDNTVPVRHDDQVSL